MNNIATVTMDMLSEYANGIETGVEVKFVKTVWKTMGVEIVMFGLTMLVALALRLPMRGARSSKCAQKMKDASALPLQQRPKVGNAGCRGSEGVRQSGNSKLESAAQRQTQPWDLINNIMTLMEDYPSQRSAARVLQIYSELRSSIRLVDSTVPSEGFDMLDVVSRSQHSSLNFFSMLVQCATRAQKCNLVENIVDDMMHHQVPRPVCFYESAMKQLAGQKQHQLALNVYDRLHADGLEPSPVTFSCLVSFAAEVGDFKRAIAFFEKLASMTTPSIRAYMTALRVLAKQRDWTRSLAIFRNMQKLDVKVDHLVLNVVLGTGVSADAVDEVEALLAEVRPMNLGDTVSYNTLIKGYAQRSDGASACRAVGCMRECGLHPTLITFNTVMDATIRDHRSGNDLAWQVLGQMRAAGLKPDKFTCSTLVKGFCKDPSAEHVNTVLDLLEEAGSCCDPMLKSALYHGVLDVVAKFSNESAFLRTLAQMRSAHVTLNDVATKKFHGRISRVCSSETHTRW